MRSAPTSFNGTPDAKGTGYLRAVVRSCVPLVGVAVVGALSGHQFLDFVIVPLVVSLPVIAWSTVKFVAPARSEQPIDTKYIIIYGCSLVVPAAGVSFYLLMDSALSHGTGSGEVLLKKCLFAFIVIVVYPLFDVILHRYSRLSGPESAGTIKIATAFTQVSFFLIAMVLLAQIIGAPLNAAIRLGYRNIAKTLINLGADVHKSDRYHATPLWYAVHGADADIAALLLEKGAKLDKNLAGLGFNRAVYARDTDMLRLLLSKGADPNAAYMGATALVHACQRKDIAKIKLLLDVGADINVKSHYPNMPYDGKSPLDVAYESGDEQVVRLLLCQPRQHE